MDWFRVIFLGLLGLVIGSFLGALTWRFPRKVSVGKGRSYCPSCLAKISWYDNIPVVSYFLLGGTCRNCGKLISWRYPLIEAATALGFIGIGYFATTFQDTVFKGSWTLPFLLLVFSVLVAIFVIDIENQIIPDSLVFFLLVVVYGSLFIVHSPDFYTRVAVGFLSALFLLMIHLLTAGRGMGLGDVKFALFGGTFIGWPQAMSWFFTSFLTGGAIGLILILLGRARLKQKIAFGPFLIIGIIISCLWGEKLLNIVGLSQ